MEVLSRYEPIVDDYEAFRAMCQQPLPSVVRVNTIKADIERTKRALEAEGVGYEGREWNPKVLELDTEKPGNTYPYFHGWIHGQEEISSLPATVLDPQPDEHVLDACAAPGGKTAQMAALMEDTGLVVANDQNLGRLSALRFNAERLGLTNVAVTRQDARNFSLKPLSLTAFDRTLVDAPCSCEGIIRKKPDTLSEWSLSHVKGVAGVQKGILQRAVQATRSGGVVVYSTCTFAPEENEAVLDHVLENENCQLVGFDTPLESRSGVTEWEGETYDDSLRRAKRFYPHHNDTGGFFCAKLEVTG